MNQSHLEFYQSDLYTVEFAKNYYTAEEIAQLRKDGCKCVCGKTIKYNSIPTHRKTESHRKYINQHNLKDTHDDNEKIRCKIECSQRFLKSVERYKNMDISLLRKPIRPINPQKMLESINEDRLYGLKRAEEQRLQNEPGVVVFQFPNGGWEKKDGKWVKE